MRSTLLQARARAHGRTRAAELGPERVQV
jgi:hypothetical protein